MIKTLWAIGGGPDNRVILGIYLTEDEAREALEEFNAREYGFNNLIFWGFDPREVLHNMLRIKAELETLLNNLPPLE